MTSNIDEPLADSAPSTYDLGETQSNELDWKIIENSVKRLRQRIYAAAEKGDEKKLANLQRLMVRNRFNLLSSIRRVTSVSTGKKTPGPDGSVFLTTTKRMDLFYQLQSVNYNSWAAPPVKRIYIPKPDGRKRPIGIPNISDRVLQGVILNALEPEWEYRFEPSSYGFRPGKAVWDGTCTVHNLLSKKDRLWVVEADVKGCFDNISHEYLITRLKQFPYVKILISWLKAGILDKDQFIPTEYGTPQGGIISPLLMNIALDGLELDLGIKRYYQGYITSRSNKIHRTLVRYADDFVVICPTKQVATDTITDINSALVKRRLRLSAEKTKITYSFDGFDFLGFTFRHFVYPQFGKNFVSSSVQDGIPKKLRHMVWTSVRTSDKSVSSMSSRLNDIFARHRGRPVIELIKALNPVIRGYCNSKRPHSHSAAARKLQNQLYHLQMGWIKRSHPKKSRSWQVERYFIHYRDYFIDNKWVFHCRDNNFICQQFIWHSQHRRWPPVVSSYSPDDGNKKYWEDRETAKFNSRNVDVQSSFDSHLAQIQSLKCPVCGTSLISRQFPLHRHHIVPTSQGGKNITSNMLLLHLPCHQTVHYCKDPDKWIPTLLEYRKGCSRPSIRPDTSILLD